MSKFSLTLLEEFKATQPFLMAWMLSLLFSEAAATFRTGSLTLALPDLHIRSVQIVLFIQDSWAATIWWLQPWKQESKILKPNIETQSLSLQATVSVALLLFYARLTLKTFLGTLITLIRLDSQGLEIRPLLTGIRQATPLHTVWSTMPISFHTFLLQTLDLFTAALKYGTREEWLPTQFVSQNHLLAQTRSAQPTTVLTTIIWIITSS